MENKTYRRRTRLSQLPSELLQSIFCRLPAKTIFVQVRWVCKAWYEVVTDPNFISMHSDWWAENHEEYLISHHRSQIARLDKWFSFSEKLEFPIASFKFELVGSCNGLLCLRETSDFQKQDHFPDTYLWNPCINRSFRKLPEIPNHQHHNKTRWCCVSAFGFDSQNNDHKVFHSVLGKENNEYVIVNWLYSLKTDSWKVIQTTYDLDRYTYPSYGLKNCQTCSNGAYYWTPYMRIRTKTSIYILWFDFCDETIRKAKLPIVYDYEVMLSLVTLNNSLVVYISDIPHPQKRPCTVDAWVMKKSSDQTPTWSWDIKLSAVIPSAVVKPLSIGILNGEILLLTYWCKWLQDDKWFFQFGVYDFKEQRIREVDIHFVGGNIKGGFSDSFTYSESLLLLEDAYRRQKQQPPPLIS